jgi:hypothetical protein
MEADDMDNKQEQLPCKVVFAPLDEIRSIEKVIDDLEAIRQELQIVSVSMKPIDEKE